MLLKSEIVNNWLESKINNPYMCKECGYPVVKRKEQGEGRLCINCDLTRIPNKDEQLN